MQGDLVFTGQMLVWFCVVVCVGGDASDGVVLVFVLAVMLVMVLCCQCGVYHTNPIEFQ